MESFQSVGKSLPQKEAGLIKQVIRLIDSKKYQKALKKVDKVLLECPEDGDSLSLKANILNCMGKKEESLPLAKQGLMKNLKSALSWHILSQVYYNQKNYPEAYKSEQKASAIAPTNNSIMRSLSLLQLHSRDYSAFRDSRKQILVNNFTGLINWAAYAVAEHLCGDLDKTITILDSFLKSLEKHMSNQELSETILYKARVLGELGRYPQMLEFLNTNRAKARDTPLWGELATRAALGARNLPEASKFVLELIEINSEHPGYFQWYLEAKEYTTEPQKLQGIREIMELHPRSNAAQREELNYLHEDILSSLGDYIIKRIRKGIPSIFSDIKALLAESPRGSIILQYVQENVESLRSHKAFTEALSRLPRAQIEQPQNLMWMLYVYSQLLDHSGRFEEALAAINEAIEHTPTVPDLYLFKAKIYKHQQLIDKAAETAKEARLLDLGDRYLNNKASKYLLRNNQIAETEEVMAVFSKEKANELNVHDMQSMWYELELAEALYRREEFAKSAEEFRWIEKHIIEMFEDQYDFHFYCFRKINLNSYVDFMAFEDTLYSHKNFLRAGMGLIRIYLKDPSVVPAKEASKLLKTLQRHHPQHVPLNTLALTMYLQKAKYLKGLRYLEKLRGTEDYPRLREEFARKIQDVKLKDSEQEEIQRELNR